MYRSSRTAQLTRAAAGTALGRPTQDSHARTLSSARAQDRTRPPMHSLPHTNNVYPDCRSRGLGLLWRLHTRRTRDTHRTVTVRSSAFSHPHSPHGPSRLSHTHGQEVHALRGASDARLCLSQPPPLARPGREATPSTLHTAHAASNRERRTKTTTPHKQNTLSPTPPTPDTPGTSSRVGICASPTPRPTAWSCCGRGCAARVAAAAAPLPPRPL